MEGVDRRSQRLAQAPALRVHQTRPRDLLAALDLRRDAPPRRLGGRGQRRSAHPARRIVYDYPETGKLECLALMLPLKQFHLADLMIVTDSELAVHNLK